MADSAANTRECRVFTRYLSGDYPDDYILNKYSAAFADGQPLAETLGASSLDRFNQLLLAFARIHPWCTRAVDIYSRFFYSDSNVRKRLILLLAILESWAPAYQRLDRLERPGNLALIVLGVAVQGVLALVLLVLATPVLLPLQILFKNRPPVREMAQ